MNDFTAKPSSALVVAENKARRTSGCVGIFFKLFDWNRRFGKKKHFPKKLLAPARANQVSKKFIADEKLPMPKQMLIANGKGGVLSAEDENVKSGAICVHSEKRQDAKSPGLVARLMGLESMPLVEKSRSHDKSGNIDTKTSRFFGGLEPDKEVVVDLEKGCVRHELQPQKIQKTGASERRPGKASAKHSSMRISGDRLSPGSVLDASFSNDSCVSSNRDDVSGNMFQSDDMDVSYDEPHLLHSDSDLFDCATSMITKENDNVSHLLDHITSLLQRANLSNMKLYPGYTNEVLLNAELLFGNGGRHPERFVDFLVGPFLDELETLAAAAWRSTVILGFDVSKGEKQNPLRNFLFDCLVECLDLRYSRYSECGFRDWCKLPTRMAMEDLVQVFDYEVRKWASLAMMSTDEVVDWQMSTSLGKWTDLDVEAFQSAAQMGELILQSLMDEVIAEFLW